MRTHVSTAGVPPGVGARRVLLAPYPAVGINLPKERSAGARPPQIPSRGTGERMNLPKARSAGACPPQIPCDTIASQPTGEKDKPAEGT